MRKRFRIEYLGQLKYASTKRFFDDRQIKVGDIVLIGNDCTKRIEWPLGRVVELFPGKDGIVRVVRLITAKGQLVRPVQRLYYLEVDSDVGPDELRKVYNKKIKSKTVHLNLTGEMPKRTSDKVDLSATGVPIVPYVTRGGRTVKRVERFQL